MQKSTKIVLPIIVIAQFCCTSLWFAGNAILEDLITNFSLSNNSLGDLTSIVQLGFILGTFSFSVFTISDRNSPSKVFFVCAILGALANISILIKTNTFITILSLRFLTGFFLAGIYPVGMKIAADFFKDGLGKALGFLVGALVLGTAFPHFLRNINSNLNWENVIITISCLSILGGLLILFLGDGPYRKRSQQFNFKAFFKVFKNTEFKAAAFGYFGHMWELYAFWTFIPIMLKMYANQHTTIDFNITLLSFLIIGIGTLGCFLSGYLTSKIDAKKLAYFILLSSFICCLVSPFVFNTETPILFLSFLFFWGFVVIADSPLFSTLVAQNADSKIKGTALTIVNCIGFSITIISIQLLNLLSETFNSNYIFMVLAFGPLFGVLALGCRNK